MPDPQSRARTAIATALGIAWPTAVPLRDGSVWLTSRYDVLPARVTSDLQAYLARRATDKVHDDRMLAEAVALLGAERARNRDEDPGLGAAAALDRLLTVPGLDQSRHDEARAMLRVALRSAAQTSPEAATRLAALPGATRPPSLTAAVSGAATISQAARSLGTAAPVTPPQRRLHPRRMLTRAIGTPGRPADAPALTADSALAALGQLPDAPAVAGPGLAVIAGSQYVRVEVDRTVGTLLAQGRLAAGTAEDPHVLRISPTVADGQLAQVWTHQISQLTQQLATPEPKGMFGRLRARFGVEQRDIRTRADYATYQLLAKEWRDPNGSRSKAEIRTELEGLAGAIKRRGGALPELPWSPDARSVPEAIELGRAAERLLTESATPNSPAALREQVVRQIDELETAVAGFTLQADTKVASAVAATVEAADLEGKAVTELGLRDLGAAERARVFRVQSVAASNKAGRHTQLATGYQQVADDAAHALTGYRDLLTAIDAGSPEAQLTALADEATDRVEIYEAASARALPAPELLETGVPTGAALLAPVGDINRIIKARGGKHGIDATAPRPIPTAEYRLLMSEDGLVIPVGGGPTEDVKQVGQVRLRMERTDLSEIVDRDHDLAQQMNGWIGAGGQGIGTASTRSSSTSFGVNLQPIMAMAPPGSAMHTASQVAAPRADVNRGQSFTQGSGLSTHEQDGEVDDAHGESLLYRSQCKWLIEYRSSPTADWSPVETVDAGEHLTWIPSAYTVQAPTATVTLEQLGRGNECSPEFPPHTVTRINGVQDISDRLTRQLRDREGALDRVAYDHLNLMVTRDTSRLLHEFTKPGGLTRPISIDGRPEYELTIEIEPVWSTATLSGEPSTEVGKEGVEVDFSGINAAETYGTSLTGTVGATALTVPTASAGRSVSRSGGQNVSSTAITPVVHRDRGPTQGVVVDFKVRATLRKIADRKAAPIVVEDTCKARLRITENDLLRAGGPAAADAVRREDDGSLRFDQDGRVLLRGDAEPPTGPQTVPPWLGAGPNQLRGPGKALAEDLQGADEARQKALTKLSEMDLVPPLDADFQPRMDALSKDPLRRAGQLANYDRVIQNITQHRIQAGINQACQDGLPVTLVDQRTGRTPHYRHFRLGVEQDFDDQNGRGTTPARIVVRLGITSDATSRSTTRSTSLPLSAGATVSDGPDKGLSGLAGKFGIKLNRNAVGRSVTTTSGRRVNRVTLAESTEPLDQIRQGIRITFAERTGRGLETPIADVPGTVDLFYEQSLTRAEAPVIEPNPKAPTAAAVRDGITVAVDAADPAYQIFSQVEAFSAVAQLHAFSSESEAEAAARDDASTIALLDAAFSSDSLVAHPDWMNGDFEVPMVITPPPPNPAQAIADRSVLSQQYKVVLRGRAVSQAFLAVTQQNTANINLTLTDASFTSGTSTSGGAGAEGGGGQTDADASSVAGSGSIGRNAGSSQSTTVSRATGQEWLLVNTGTHYEFLERYELEADIVDSTGAVIQTVQLDDALAQKAMAERRALALYAKNQLDLPLPVVADVAERYLHDRVTMDPQVAIGFRRRYELERAGATTGLAAEHDSEQLAAKVFENAGTSAPSQTATVDEQLLATEKLAAQRRAVDPGPSYRESLASAQIDSLTILGQDGEPVDLFELVRPQFEEIAPGVLTESKLLAPALRVNLAADAHQGELENMLGARGFVATIEVPIEGQQRPDLYEVQITAEMLGEYTVDGTPEIPGVEAIGLDQGYGYHGQDRSVGHSTTYSAELGGNAAAGDSGNVGAKVARVGSKEAGSNTTNTIVNRSGHFDMAEVKRSIVYTSKVTRIQGAGAAALTSARWKLDRTTPDELSLAATPRQLQAELTLLVPKELLREPGTRPQLADHTEHRPIRVTESAVPESTQPYGLGDSRTNQLYDVLSAELSEPRVLGPAGFAEHRGALEGHLKATAMKAYFHELISDGGLRLPPMVARGNGRTTISTTIKARMTGLELVEGPIGDAQTGAVSRRETSARSGSSGSHVGPGTVTAGAEGGPVSVGGSVGEQVKEQSSTAYGSRLETSKFEEGEVVTVRIPVSYDVGIEQVRDNGRGTPETKRTKAIPDAARGQFYVKMLKHEYLAALQAMETGVTVDAALADTRLTVTPDGVGRPDIEASETVIDAAGNEVHEPYRPLVAALAQAQQERQTLVVSLRDRDDHEQLYLAVYNPGDGTARLEGVADGGFGAALGSLDGRIALMAQGRVDLRELYNTMGPNDDFATKAADALVQNGVPASMLKGLDYGSTAQQFNPGVAPPPPQPAPAVTTGRAMSPTGQGPAISGP
ncbi:hypothetical protein ACFCV3_18985 [Kribbella sp. NPDC056345]|uniref:hypothetical protein n=1 Tax=Kribbella sp. NPDC056345 TaxID=3345789 RepID=UPI0035DF2C95